MSLMDGAIKGLWRDDFGLHNISKEDGIMPDQANQDSTDFSFASNLKMLESSVSYF